MIKKKRERERRHFLLRTSPALVCLVLGLATDNGKSKILESRGWGRVWGNLSQVFKKGKITEAVIPIAKAHQECRHNESGSPALYPAFVYLTV